MKYILSLIITAALSNSVFSQSASCSMFHKKNCSMAAEGGTSKGKKEKEELWQYNSQSKSALFTQGMTSKLRCVVYKEMSYRISVCCESALGDKVSYKIYDYRTKELLFDNSLQDNAQMFEFNNKSTRQLEIEVLVPKGATEKEKHKPADEACVGLLIEQKTMSKQGF